jgi:hypothetical protein
VSASQVSRILADLNLKPHKARGRLTRRDTPDFWQRAAEVCALYLEPPEGAVVLSIDEKTAIAARSRRYPGRPARPGKPVRQEFKCHGDFASRNDLIEKLEAYTIGHNETAKRYRWTYEGTPLKAI